jgi:hypothetical protein
MPICNMTDTHTCDNCPGRTDLSVAVDLGSVLAGQQRGLRAQAHHPRHVEVGRYCRVVTSFSILLCKLEMSIVSSILPNGLTTCSNMSACVFGNVSTVQSNKGNGTQQKTGKKHIQYFTTLL